MAARAIPFPATWPWSLPVRAPRPAPLILLLAFAVVAMLPSGFQGGGGDDWHYLQAARCWNAAGGWLTSGACLPVDHWQARWPLIAPMALAIGWLGESRASVQLVPLLYALAALLLFSSIVERLFGRGAALAGAAALLFTPVFALTMLQPNIGIVELAFLLGFAAAGLTALDKDRGAWAFAAGLSLALAVAARETALAAALVAAGAALFVPAARRRLLIPAAAGFAVPNIIEMLLFAARTGDPLRRVHVALGHVSIPSTELAQGVETGGSPLFNPDVISGWRPASGIDLHWSVNGPLNLLVHPDIALTLLAAAMLALAYGRSTLVEAEARRRFAILIVAAGLIAFLLIYALAIDPKARMFLFPLCAVAAIGGALASRAWSGGSRLLVAALWTAIVARGALVLISGPDFPPAERLAARWLAAHPGEIAMSETTRRNLALVPGAGAARRDAAAPYRLDIRWRACSDAPLGAVVESYDFRASEPRLLPAARTELAMCLYRR